MTELVDNEFGMEYQKILIKKLRIFRTGKHWLVEYRRDVRAWAPWDYFWWYNDGQYVAVSYTHLTLPTICSV